jgi:hypothetical protein
MSADLISMELILQTLYWIYKNAIYSRVFILDWHTNIKVWNLYYLFLAGNWVVSSLFDCCGKFGNAWKLWIYDGLRIPRKKEGHLLVEIYGLWNLGIYYLLDFTKYFCLWIPTLVATCEIWYRCFPSWKMPDSKALLENHKNYVGQESYTDNLKSRIRICIIGH